MPSSTFRRRQCLQSFHAFKRGKFLHLHFEDDNVFSHSCFQKAIMFSFTLSKTTMSSSQRLHHLLSLCFIGLDVLCVYAFIENENNKKKEENEKRRTSMSSCFPSFTTSATASGRSDGEIARTKLVSLSLLPFYFQ